MTFTTLICLPWIVIIVIFLIATIFHVVNHDHVFKPKYRNKHGRR